MQRLLITCAVSVLLGHGWSASAGHPGAAIPADASADAAVVTALDLSDSIMRHEEWLQFEGIARAVLAPDFLDAVARGHHRRISFAVFTWSSHGRHRIIVPWTLIDGPGSAVEVATLLRRTPRPARLGGGDDDESGPGPLLERRTNVSGAIRFGASLFGATPLQSHRQILNVIGNGVDNVAAGAGAARDAAVAAGITINGVVLGDDPALAGYFRARVTGGFGSFVMRVAEPRAFADVMLAKFLRDLIAAPAPDLGGGPGRKERAAGAALPMAC